MYAQLDDLEEEPKKPKAKWYRRLSFWHRAFPILATCCLLVIAALFRKFGPEQVSSVLQERIPNLAHMLPACHSSFISQIWSRTSKQCTARAFDQCNAYVFPCTVGIWRLAHAPDIDALKSSLWLSASNAALTLCRS